MKTSATLSAVLLLFQEGEISAGAACQRAGIDRYTFIEACCERGIPVVNYPPEELEAEMAWPRKSG